MDNSLQNWLSAFDTPRAICDGMISSEQMVEACAAQVNGGEPQDG